MTWRRLMAGPFHAADPGGPTGVASLLGTSFRLTRQGSGPDSLDVTSVGVYVRRFLLPSVRRTRSRDRIGRTTDFVPDGSPPGHCRRTAQPGGQRHGGHLPRRRRVWRSSSSPTPRSCCGLASGATSSRPKRSTRCSTSCARSCPSGRRSRFRRWSRRQPCRPSPRLPKVPHRPKGIQLKPVPKRSAAAPVVAAKPKPVPPVKPAKKVVTRQEARCSQGGARQDRRAEASRQGRRQEGRPPQTGSSQAGPPRSARRGSP